MIFIKESAPPEAIIGKRSLAASERMPSSYFLRCAIVSKVQLNVLMSQARIAPSWPPDTNCVGPFGTVPEAPLIESYLLEL